MLPALFLILAAPPALVASFTHDDGFVVLHLKRGNVPVATAAIKIYGGGEAPLATGELEDGSGTFPMPRGGACLVGITIDGKECDLITLERHGEAVTPARVSLTFGTRPCCRAAAGPRKDVPTADDAPRRADTGMILLGLGGGVCLLLALFVLLMPRGSACPGERAAS